MTVEQNRLSEVGDEGYMLLAGAVIQSAAEDYSDVIRQMLYASSRVKRRHLSWEKEKLEVFFHSEWFELLTDIAPDSLIKSVTENTVRIEKEKAHERIRKLRRKQEKKLQGRV